MEMDPRGPVRRVELEDRSSLVVIESAGREDGRCDLDRGIVTDRDAGTITFHLTKPDPEFLYKLAFAMASAVPAGTPKADIGRTPLPATGPYMTKSFTPEKS
jgi:peptide/nickel transport system substrate-binding protein